MSRLEEIVDAVAKNLAEKNAARERALTLSREVIRSSANAIRAVHRGEMDRAADLLKAAGKAVAEAATALQPHPEVFHAGFLQDAQKEYAEASITNALILDAPLPGPDDLKVGYAAYLNGLGEAVGELRRYILDYLRRGELSRCEALLRTMEDIYSLLVTIDYPDAITGGLRRTTDVTRGILEKTRGDLTVAARQYQLEETLRLFEARLPRPDQPADAGPEQP
jgi:translin